MMEPSEHSQSSDEKKIHCTCGFNFLLNEVTDRHDKIGSDSKQLGARNTEDYSKGVNDRLPLCLHSPNMDASFVQVPTSDVILSSEASTFQRSSGGQPTQQNTETTITSFSYKEDSESAVPRQPFEWNNYGSMYSSTKLYRIATTLSDFPALCRRCVQRYVLIP
jgi:hypothetical protein